ncbi:MAG: amidase [SAR86 cluster bacterium]|uniref:Amidase n=1 Tax=SAR86 cluster bacterium TaxID=2030880 RepID=A0A2A4WSH2_9GAMM|nr:MAG: amidase [SAR86 cluster bacterium]
MKRREFLSTSLQGSLAASLSMLIPPGLLASELPADITELSASKLSAAIRDRQVSCLEVMQAYLQRIERYNPVYNAIVNLAEQDSLFDQARRADVALDKGEYWGWMHGMPHAVKDLSNVAGMITTSGSRIYANRVAQSDSSLVANVRRQGAIFIGKTNTPEFGLGSQTYNSVFGATGSAWNPALTAGGSSGGAACGLGTHMLPVADGSDMMGSLRNPGAFNNVIGFRPSKGRVGGGDPLNRGLSTSGPMGRNTEDTIRLLLSIAGPVNGQPNAIQDRLPEAEQFTPLNLQDIKIGWMGDFEKYLAMEPGVLDVCESSLNLLETAGAKVEPCMPDFDMSELWRTWVDLRNLGRIGAQSMYNDPAQRALLKPEYIWEIEQSLVLTATQVFEAGNARARWYREIVRLFEQFDFLVLPTAQVFPFSKDIHWPTEIAGRKMDTYHRWMEVVIGGSLAGNPLVNVPAGFDEQGRPMGIQVMGRFGEDKKVLEFALAYEQVTDFLQQRPNLVASS